MNLGSLCLSRNLSVYSKLSNLLTKCFIIFSSIVSVYVVFICSVYGDATSVFPNIGKL